MPCKACYQNLHDCWPLGRGARAWYDPPRLPYYPCLQPQHSYLNLIHSPAHLLGPHHQGPLTHHHILPLLIRLLCLTQFHINYLPNPSPTHVMTISYPHPTITSHCTTHQPHPAPYQYIPSYSNFSIVPPNPSLTTHITSFSIPIF